MARGYRVGIQEGSAVLLSYLAQGVLQALFGRSNPASRNRDGGRGQARGVVIGDPGVSHDGYLGIRRKVVGDIDGAAHAGAQEVLGSRDIVLVRVSVICAGVDDNIPSLGVEIPIAGGRAQGVIDVLAAGAKGCAGALVLIHMRTGYPRHFVGDGVIGNATNLGVCFYTGAVLRVIKEIRVGDDAIASQDRIARHGRGSDGAASHECGSACLLYTSPSPRD